ncbi:hypothetical protein HK098_006278 [Nowakowskiella sp. JEL0407]|nr:hypothetical protein HK098_006278 [Nowakowskiella sp. JEL0407]
MHSLTAPLQGALNAIAYGFDFTAFKNAIAYFKHTKPTDMRIHLSNRINDFHSGVEATFINATSNVMQGVKKIRSQLVKGTDEHVAILQVDEDQRTDSEVEGHIKEIKLGNENPFVEDAVGSNE